jgi:hypothetical protein
MKILAGHLKVACGTPQLREEQFEYLQSILFILNGGTFNSNIFVLESIIFACCY